MTSMSSPLTPLDISYGGMMANSMYHTAIVTGLVIGYAKIHTLITKNAIPSKLDFDGYVSICSS